jgi:hypothetical protein
MATELSIPTIHLNGTSSDALIDQWTTAGQALLGAIAALTAAWPNARDYYVQGPTAADEAKREHEARIKVLRDMRDDVTRIVEGIEEQIAEKKARRGR